MDALVKPTKSQAAPRFVTEFDGVPGFWNTLLAFDRNDLIAELVQNDLDQGATRTVISFESSQLICEGNGRPVEPDGWKRLGKMLGAGDAVPAKRGKIGVKNHGLKAGFTIGDELQVLSAGRSITQTLYARGRDEPPYPGASAMPERSPQAPPSGCRIVISYRERPIRPTVGEAIEFGPVNAREIDALFTAACAATPEQFAGIVSPEIAQRYEIVLRHWRLGEVHFAFSCTRARKIARGIESFRRRCVVSGTIPLLPTGLHEEAARRQIPAKGSLKQRAADFYRRGNRIFVEVAWPIDARGRPQVGTGRFRYPIGYPIGSHEACTGHAVFFSAPIASDAQRHGPSRNDSAYTQLREACEALLLDVLARYAVPRWGADALNVLQPTPGAENPDEAVRPLLAALARRDSIPTVIWREAARSLLRGHRGKGDGGGPAALPARPMEVRKYRFIVPTTTWDRAAISPPLSLIAPPSERQLDPRLNREIIRLLADGHTEGFNEAFITFDEADALTRAMGEANEYFDAPAAPDREFAQPSLARAYLDVIHAALTHDKCGADTEDALREALLLPDALGHRSRFHDLYLSTPIPADLPGLRLPPVLHRELSGHPLLRRPKWRRKQFTMARFLESGALEDADETTRRLFWKWLCRNMGAVGRKERAKLADVAIWPDNTGSLCTLPELCEPRSVRIAAALGSGIRRPHEQVRRSRIIASSTKSRTGLRRVPTPGETNAWLRTRLEPFVPGEAPSPEMVEALQRFETDLATLLKDPAIARILKCTPVDLPALARDGQIRWRGDLVMPGPAIDRLSLSARFVLADKARATVLDKLSPACTMPTAAMLIATFAEDAKNFSALQSRLHQFLALTEPGDPERLQLAEMPVIPLHGRPHAPCTLAFIGPRGDYWGEWKGRLPGTNLSQDDQHRYRAAGVTSALPNTESSRSFFQWLAQQDEQALERHVGIVLRHILHPHAGPESWAHAFTDIPFIPVRSRNGIRLVSLQMARHRPVFLPDARDIADAVIESDTGVQLVIDRVREVTEPIAEPLRRVGVRSLREELGEPEHVAGLATIEKVDPLFLDIFAILCSAHFRRTLLKRLDELGVESDLVRRDWHDRLCRIKAIRFAERVEACYRLRGKSYKVSADAGFDPGSGSFWIVQGGRAGLGTFCEAIAAQLVFKTTARPVHLLALEKALALEIDDPSFGRPAATGVSASGGSMEGEGEEVSRESETRAADGNHANQGDTGEAVFGHSPFKPDASRNIPKPRPLATGSATSSQNHSHPRRGSTGEGTKPSPEIEREHIEALKRDHYASHCQVCLCERSPEDLAPPGSYIEWEEVRRRVVEAHHVDLKSAGGARHAGNLVLLCKLHHDNFGRRLTRAAVTMALQGTAKDKVIHFSARGGKPSAIQGQTVAVMIQDTGEVAEMFFTHDHVNYWLAHSPQP